MALISKHFEKVDLKTGVGARLGVLTEQERIIQAKYEAMGGEARLGKPREKKARMWVFDGHAIVYNKTRKAAFHVMGAIYEKWIDRGGLKWGEPTTDETATPDGVGRYNHFNEGGASIYWHPNTGAWGIYGDIRKRWAELGWERSYLGYHICRPTAPERGGR